MANRGCKNSPNSITFCYICGDFVVKKHQRNITDFVKKVYFAYFGVEIGNQDKCWVPHKVCYVCVEDLRKWYKKEKKAFKFAVPMVWREQKNHSNDCYFCSIDVSGYNSKNKKVIVYPNLTSADRPVKHGPGLPVPEPPQSIDDVLQSSPEFSESQPSTDEFQCPPNLKPQLFTQAELNDLVRDLCLTKEKAWF